MAFDFNKFGQTKDTKLGGSQSTGFDFNSFGSPKPFKNTPEEQNYFQRVSGEYQRIGGEVVKGIEAGGAQYQEAARRGDIFEATGGLLRSGLRTVGGVAEAAFTPIFEAPGVKQVVGGIVNKIAQIPGTKEVITEATRLSQKYPEQAKDLKNIVDIVTLGGGKAIEAPLATEARLLGQDVRAGAKIALSPSEEAVQSKVVDLFNRSIKPSTKAFTLGQRPRYENNIIQALKTIKTNVDQLNIEDATGELVSRTPETVQEFGQALEQTKGLVFKQYDDIAKRAGQTGVVIDAKPIAQEILKVADNKAVQLANPELINYVKGWSQRLNELDTIDVETTQEVIKLMNNNLRAFYAKPSPELASKAVIDAGIANNFRQALDRVIEGATGEQYQALKNQYAALKAIENDVIRAVARDARKNVKGLLDYTDILTNGQMIGGILSLSPAMFTKGAIERLIKEGIQILNDPNRAIRNIFNSIEVEPRTRFTPQSATGQFIKNPKLGLSVEDVSKNAYKGETDLTTKILKDLEGKTTVSKQYILDATNRGELKQVERDLIRQTLTNEGDTINVSDFAKKVKAELLPLKVVKNKDLYTGNNYGAKFENITLPNGLRGNVKNYRENVYESPIKTSAGGTHFGEQGKEGYFGHTRIEDMADNKTRRVIEVQSDLYQKGNLEKELKPNNHVNGLSDANAKKYLSDTEYREFRKTFSGSAFGNAKSQKAHERHIELARIVGERMNVENTANLSKLQQYNDPTAHFRMVREEIKKAAQDGKTKLQFPTGETAMKIEGLGSRESWYGRVGGELVQVQPDNLIAGATITRSSGAGDLATAMQGDQWIITDVLGDGKFKAVPKQVSTSAVGMEAEGAKGVSGMVDFNKFSKEQQKQIAEDLSEQFDISGKVDTNNPIYKFYEKEMQKYLTKFGGKKVVDDKGVSWIEVPIKKEMAKMPVEAFGLVPFISNRETEKRP